ncbi:hypothetical protein HYALB_00007610 [Hymenoscyphus albidus]|uniref:Uncharacterized protein n=1 Tax=Hymenoscyphus albidus TaxID=595503 RepID=A0A9N9LJ37_9HELO|nr:hypothetical protein HYALB_00007610 [Hymenoscyphus albidus]
MAETETSTIASTSKSTSISPPAAIKPVQIQTSQTTPHVDKVNELHETDEADSIHENSRGATELATFAKLRRNYTRASTRYASSTVSEKPSTSPGGFAEGRSFSCIFIAKTVFTSSLRKDDELCIRAPKV